MATEDEVTTVFLSPIKRETSSGRNGEDPGHQLRECDGVVQLGSTGVGAISLGQDCNGHRD